MSGRTLNKASMTFSKEKRIRKRRDFLRIQRFGARSFGRFVVIIAQRSFDLPAGKIGITVPKKVGAAHIRNKIKRRIRHIFRFHQELFKQKSLVVVARTAAHQSSFSHLESDIIDTCAKLSLTRRGHS
jgi:ribonuclease P protein component